MIVVLDSRRPTAVGLDVTVQLESFLGECVAMKNGGTTKRGKNEKIVCALFSKATKKVVRQTTAVILMLLMHTLGVGNL